MLAAVVRGLFTAAEVSGAERQPAARGNQAPPPQLHAVPARGQVASRGDTGEWLTMKQAATYTRYSAKTLQRHVSSGRLKGSKPSAHWRFKRSDLDQWLEGIHEESGNGRASARRTAPPPKGYLASKIVDRENGR